MVLNFYANMSRSDGSSPDNAPVGYLTHTEATPWASADQMRLNLQFFQHCERALGSARLC